tara:strand:+ start:260 stop:589 length:330 start_codon:yes stop_codon:yes gene_type:complete
MKKILLLSLLLGSISPVWAAPNPLVPPPSPVWAMAVEVCKLFPPDIESAVKRGILHLPRECRWFVIGGQEFAHPNTLSLWPTKELCEKAIVPMLELFFERQRKCQMLPK